MEKFIIKETIPVDIVNRIILESNCILDTDRECQTGTTPRVIWALALGKKIVSTNLNLKNMPFYNEEQIVFIDRNNPILDIDFVKSRKEVFTINDYILNLRIDNWINNFIQ